MVSLCRSCRVAAIASAGFHYSAFESNPPRAQREDHAAQGYFERTVAVRPPAKGVFILFDRGFLLRWNGALDAI
jgi:hypothetical protein